MYIACLIQIIVKLVFLYIGFSWKLRPTRSKKDALQALEKVLFDMGLHGNVQWQGVSRHEILITTKWRKLGKEVNIK